MTRISKKPAKNTTKRMNNSPTMKASILRPIEKAIIFLNKYRMPRDSSNIPLKRFKIKVLLNKSQSNKNRIKLDTKSTSKTDEI